MNTDKVFELFDEMEKLTAHNPNARLLLALRSKDLNYRNVDKLSTFKKGERKLLSFILEGLTPGFWVESVYIVTNYLHFI